MSLFGPDGSYHQFGGRNGASNPSSWLRLTSADWDAIDFVLWRSSIGTRIDWSYPRMCGEAERRGVPFAAYHFVYPVDRYPAARQAETFRAAVGADNSIPCMLDWEHDGSLAPTWSDVQWVADAIRDRGHRVPLVYTGRWYWEAKGRPHMAGEGLDLVHSDYGPNRHGSPAAIYAQRGGDAGRGWTSYGGLSAEFWQFGSLVQWGNRAMDMNAFRGSRESLSRWFKAPTPPAPPITPPLVVSPPAAPPPTTPIPVEDDMQKFVTRNGLDYWLWTNIVRTPIKYPGPTNPDGSGTPAGDLRLCALLMGHAADGVKHAGLNAQKVPAPILLPEWEWPMFDAAPVVAP